MKERIIPMRNCKIPEIELAYQIPLETFHQWNTKIEFLKELWDISFEVIMKQQSSCPNIDGLWQDVIFANVDVMVGNLIKDKLESILFSSSFTMAGVQYTIECKIYKTLAIESTMASVPDKASVASGVKNAKSRK